MVASVVDIASAGAQNGRGRATLLAVSLFRMLVFLLAILLIAADNLATILAIAGGYTVLAIAVAILPLVSLILDAILAHCRLDRLLTPDIVRVLGGARRRR